MSPYLASSFQDQASFYLEALPWIFAPFVVGCLAAFVVALLAKTFPRLTGFGLRRVGGILVFSSLLAVAILLIGLWHIASEDTADVFISTRGLICVSVSVVGLLSLLGAIAFKGVRKAVRGEVTKKGMLTCIGCGLITIPAVAIPPAALLLPFGFLAVVYGFGGYFALSMRLSSINGEPSAAPNGGPATQLASPGVTEGPPSVS